MHADEAAAWDDLHERFEVKRINHQEAYSLDGACAHMAEEYFSRLRRAEIGIHHHIAGSYLLRHAQESSWREDNRRVSNDDQINWIAELALERILPLLPLGSSALRTVAISARRANHFALPESRQALW